MSTTSPTIDANDTIAREKHFIDQALLFLSTIKLNLPALSESKLRTDTEIDECNKAQKERKEDRKDKSRERIFKRKPKEATNKIKLEEFVGTKEFDRAVGNKRPSMVAPKFKKVGGKKKRLGKGRRNEVKNRKRTK